MATSLSSRAHRLDAVVVGAGLAGLSAAYELDRRGKSVLLLEATNRAGGKVHTSRMEGTTYERGAVFAFERSWVPFTVAAGDLMEEAHPSVGIYADGRLVEGASVSACLQGLLSDAGVRERARLMQFLTSPLAHTGLLDPVTYTALNAFFRVIHPGELSQYVAARRIDSLSRHDTAHYEAGNGALVEAYLEQIGTGLQTDRLVRGLRQSESRVRVEWSDGSRRGFCEADGVVLAVPPREARDLVGENGTAAAAFLHRVRCGAGVAVVLGLAAVPLRPLSYVVVPDGPINTFVFHHQGRGHGGVTVTAYLVGGKALEYWEATDRELVDLSLSQLATLGLGDVGADHLEFSDVCRWPEVGPIISEETYGGFGKACLFPMDKVILAGDYTWWSDSRMPYGMEAAIRSGRRAAELLCGRSESLVCTALTSEPLAVTSVTGLEERGPTHRSAISDGTVAYYGLILKAEPDPAIERYLLAEAEEGLWEYGYGYGITSLDSALVMEGLLSTGSHQALLRWSVDRLVAEFYDDGEGGFRTIPHSRKLKGTYWGGADCPATAHCAWLVRTIAPERYAEVLSRCADYLRRKQLITGGWPAKWFPSLTIPAFYAVRFLAEAGPGVDQACRRCCEWLCGTQKSDGSWQGSVIETAAAVLALTELGERSEAVRRALRWILSRRVGDGWPGEPILKYWVDEEGRRIMYDTRDHGRITSAWARIALRENTWDKSDAR